MKQISIHVQTKPISQPIIYPSQTQFPTINDLSLNLFHLPIDINMYLTWTPNGQSQSHPILTRLITQDIFGLRIDFDGFWL
jgi:hypothetical protein